MAQTGSVFTPRGRTDSRVLSKRLDADGNVVEVEWREDEEQNVKLQETVDLLLAAGYFRARIKGLSPFDKVVGGMTWCIETCNIDIDVDLLFQENLTIGQKIALTEKIVAVLPKMKCPHRLEPHQIQGLDFIHIFPVVQWLVKRAIETREELGDSIRVYSIYQFNKNFRTPDDEIANQLKEKSLSTATHVLETYKPRRIYRRNVAQQIDQESIRVQSTLLEYGKNLGVARSIKSKEEGNRRSSVDNEEAAAVEQMKSLMSGMSATEDYELRLSASAVSSIVDHQQMASSYDEKMPFSSSDISKKLGGAQHHKRIVESLNKQISQRSNLLDEKKLQVKNLQEQYSAKQKKLTEMNEFNKSIEGDMTQFEQLETGENKVTLDKLRSLIAMNECLKTQEQEFKAHCKEEMVRLQKNLEDLNSENVEDDSENQERCQLIETQYQSDRERLNKIRLLLARKNREIAMLQRKIDEIPSRAELSQYQRRFVELYNQVAAKHKETKQFYTLYNTLDDTKLYLSKEVNLLNSILDNFTEAMASTNTREQFLKQFEGIVEGIKTNKAKLEKKKQEEKMRRDQLSDTYLDLIEKQRLYFKSVKDLKEECRKNELLIAKMKGHGQ